MGPIRLSGTDVSKARESFWGSLTLEPGAPWYCRESKYPQLRDDGRNSTGCDKDDSMICPTKVSLGWWNEGACSQGSFKFTDVYIFLLTVSFLVKKSWPWDAGKFFSLFKGLVSSCSWTSQRHWNRIFWPRCLTPFVQGHLQSNVLPLSYIPVQGHLNSLS